MEELQSLCAQVEAMKATRQRDPEMGDASEQEQETSAKEEQEEEYLSIKLLKEVVRDSSKSKADVPTCNGILNPKEVLNWVNSMDKHFDYEEVPTNKKLKFYMTKLKVRASLWWDGAQSERKKKNKQPIKSCDRMMVKLKDKFLPKDYQLSLYRKTQNLRQRLLIVKEYMEEIYKVNIREGYTKEISENTSRYINGVILVIQYEINMLSLSTIEEAYQCALKGEEN